MKKNIVILFILIISGLVGRAQTTLKKLPQQRASTNTHKAMLTWPLCGASFDALVKFPPYATLPYTEIIDTATANVMISNYWSATSYKVDGNSDVRYFMFDAGTFLNYLYNLADSNVQDVGFCISKDFTAAKNLTLIAIGMDANKHPICLPAGLLSSGLKCNDTYSQNTCNVNWKNNFERPVSETAYTGSGMQLCPSSNIFPFARSIARTTGIPYSSYVSRTDANDMINNYDTTGISEKNIVFFFDAGTLFSYIYSATGIQDIELMFARKTASNSMTVGGKTVSSLTLIISGVDNNGNHVYFSNSTIPTGVLEHAYPCPNDCAVSSFNKLRGLDTIFIRDLLK